ncbi:MAG: SET domain-containing protein-lysine N-methyltransferase [Streptosporangiaceae bacterium]
MAAGDYDDAPTVRSWITPKATKGGASAIAGQGVHAIGVVAGGEVVAVKGGHIVAASVVADLPDDIRDSAFPIAADCFLAALTYEEHDGVMMRVNHSCEPNVGMGGNVLLVSMRDIAAGEELTIDYALFLGDPGFAMECRCGTAACRGVVRGTDWMRADLQERYRGWFSWWLQQKITQTQGHQGQCP